MNVTEYNLDEFFQVISSYLLISSILNIIFATLALYLLIVLSLYLYKNKSKLYFCISSKKTNKYATISKIVILVVNVMVLVRCLCAVSVFGFNKGFNISTILSDEEKVSADLMCQVDFRVIDLTLVITTDLIYFFLWIRQRIFYVRSEFKMFNNKCVGFISVGSIVVMLLWEVVFITCYFTFVRYHFDSFISLCIVVPDVNIFFWSQRVYILWGTRTLVIELLLLGLFIFPLKKYENWRKKNSIKSLNSTSLNKMVKKVIILSVIASISDILAVILPTLPLYATLYIIPVTTAVFNFSMLINLFAAIGCFDDWKSILCPCKCA